MKRIVKIISIITVVLMLFACSKNKPDKVAKAFLSSLYKMEYDSAKTLCTNESFGYIEYKKLIDSYVTSIESTPTDKIIIDITETKVEGNNAECKYKISGVPDLPKEVQTIDLIKKDGKWLVDLHAENLNFNSMKQELDSAFAKQDTVPPID